MKNYIKNKTNLDVKPIITQKFSQSLDILMMTSIELNKYIELKNIENPAIEIENNYGREESLDEILNKVEWLNSYNDENRVYLNINENKKNDMIFTRNEETLSEHLIKQLNMLKLKKSDYNIAQYIIFSLDEHGYYKDGIDAVCENFKIGRQHAYQILKVIQSFEPYGIGAENLKQCLMIQARQKGFENPHLYEIIDNYLSELAKNRLKYISDKTGVSIDQTKKNIALIKSLNPHPGSSFIRARNIQYITPDVFVVSFSGYFEILVNEFSYKTVSINKNITDILKRTTDSNVIKYINENINEVIRIKEMIQNRNSTLNKSVLEIVKIQESFFKWGPGNLVPMKLEDVAGKINMHVSTVSRAVHGKYLQCRWGTFSLKYFFSNAVHSAFSPSVSSKKIKQEIHNIINLENRKNPLSDEKIAKILKTKNMDISRRTVSKYRKELNIPSSSMRKQY